MSCCPPDACALLFKCKLRHPRACQWPWRVVGCSIRVCKRASISDHACVTLVRALRQSEVSLASLALAPANGHSEQSAAAVAAANTRTVTGVLTSRPTSRDIKIDGFSMGLNGVELIQA